MKLTARQSSLWHPAAGRVIGDAAVSFDGGSL